MNALALLTEVNDGKVMDDLQKALATVLEAVDATRLAGSVTLKIRIKPTKDPVSKQVGIFCDVAGKPPHVERPPEWLYLAKGGMLSRKDPRQPELPGLRLPVHDSLDGQALASGERE